MPASSPTLRKAVARAGHAAVSGDPARIAQTRRDLAAEQLASYIERIVAQAPPLTDEQRDRLALLLRPAVAASSLLAPADPAAHAAPSREALLNRFEHEVDPDGVLPPDERASRAEHARKASSLGLALNTPRPGARRPHDSPAC